MSKVQYRIQLSKKEELVEGPDDADVVIMVPIAEAGTDPTVAYMRGKLKATGHTGVLLDELASGRAAAAISRIASSAG
jgi:hypothetical protein